MTAKVSQLKSQYKPIEKRVQAAIAEAKVAADENRPAPGGLAPGELTAATLEDAQTPVAG